MSLSSRRHAIAGGLLLTKAETAFSYQANSKLQVGVIGTGNRGRYVGKMFSNDPRSEVVAICDIYPDQIDRAKTDNPAWGSAKVFKDYGDLLAAPGIDAVQITTPVYLHPLHFEAAVKAKKNIYCEKPAGASVSGIKKLIAAAKQADPNSVIFFGFQQRFGPEYLKAMEIYKSGQLGELLLMRAEWMVGGIGNRREIPPDADKLDKMGYWYAWRAKSGDFIVEQDCHGVDVLNWFVGAHPIKAVGGGGKGRRGYGDNLDHVNITYEYPKNLYGYLHGTQLVQRSGVVREQFFGQNGVLETTRRYYEFNQGPGKIKREEVNRDITIDEVEAFITHIIEKKPMNMAFDAADSTLTSLLGRLAVDLHREVTWDELMKTD